VVSKTYSGTLGGRGDTDSVSVLTPAQSVLGAIQGLEVAAPNISTGESPKITYASYFEWFPCFFICSLFQICTYPFKCSLRVTCTYPSLCSPLDAFLNVAFSNLLHL
jgi:hypothetical protein